MISVSRRAARKSACREPSAVPQPLRTELVGDFLLAEELGFRLDVHEPARRRPGQPALPAGFGDPDDTALCLGFEAERLDEAVCQGPK